MKNISMRMVVFLSAVNIVAAQSNMFRLRSELSTEMKMQTQPFAGQPKEKKSAAAAVLYSLLIPGMGELYTGRFDQGKYSLIAEGTLWLSYVSYRQYGLWIREDARNYSASHAGVQVNGKADQFFVDVANFDNTFDYNEKKLRDRTPEKMYDINSEYYWNWDADINRQQFRSLRVSSERVLNNSKFIIGAVIVNHIISAINAARLTKQYNSSQDEGLGAWWLESSLINQGVKPDGITVSIVHRF